VPSTPRTPSTRRTTPRRSSRGSPPAPTARSSRRGASTRYALVTVTAPQAPERAAHPGEPRARARPLRLDGR
jgi:hypothetical protein